MLKQNGILNFEVVVMKVEEMYYFGIPIEIRNFYRDVFNECHKYGIEPLVSIMHHDTPMALAIKQDGWLCKDTIGAYVIITEVL